jgi:predicted phosphodiesterase
MAFLSDIHGNLPALEAVLDVLAARAIVDVFVAGDLLLGGEQPLEVWQRLSGIGARCTRGVSDTALATVSAAALSPGGQEDSASAARFAETRKLLGDLILRRLGALPTHLRVPMIDGRELLMVHGSPADAYEGISHDMEDAELRGLLADEVADILVCGATHVPFERRYDETEIVNVGSVGEAPEGRVAHYTVVLPKVSGAEIQQEWIEY